MPALIVRPKPDRVLVQKRAIATVPAEIATFRSPLPRGTRLNDIPLEHRACQVYLHEGAKRFIDRMRARGYEYEDFYDVHVYGPFPSYDLPRKMRDLSEFNVDPNVAKNLVETRARTIVDWADYRLVANFVARPALFDEPVVVDTERPGAR